MELWQYLTLGSGVMMLVFYFKRRSARLSNDE
jgi:hypothetical protein